MPNRSLLAATLAFGVVGFTASARADEVDDTLKKLIELDQKVHILAMELREASWWHGLEGRRFDIAIANPPYIAADDPHLAALRHEPVAALTPGGDGLGALRAIVAGASASLVPGGWLLVEHGFDQGAAVREMLAGAGFSRVETRRDLAGHERATGGRRPPP